MSEAISRIASEFLARYLSNNPSVEFHKLVCPAKRYEIHNSHEAAQDFLEQIQSQAMDSERIDITDAAPVIIRRVCLRHLPAYLAGTRRDGALIWAHEIRFATSFRGDEVEVMLKTLTDRGIHVQIMPALELRHGSL